MPAEGLNLTELPQVQEEEKVAISEGSDNSGFKIKTKLEDLFSDDELENRGCAGCRMRQNGNKCVLCELKTNPIFAQL